MVRRTRILHVIGQLRVGGAEKQLLELVSHLDRNRYVATVCSLSGEGPIGVEIRRRGVEVLTLERRHSYEFSRLIALYRIMREQRYDIVHAFLPSANAYGCLAAKLAGVPVIICSARSVDYVKQKHDLLLTRTLAAIATKMTANSQAVKVFLTRKVKVRPDKIAVVYNGVNLTDFRLTRSFDVAVKKRAMGMNSKLPVVGTVASLSHHKGYFDFLDAAAKILQEMATVQFLVVGEGSLRNELQEYAGKIGILERVFFTGFQRQVQDVLPLMDIFVLASLREGFSNAILEAMSLARPVVATDVGGNAEAVLNNVTGLLVGPGKPEFLARAVLHLLQDKTKANRMGELGRERVEKLFTVGKMVSAVEVLYESLMRVGTA